MKFIKLFVLVFALIALSQTAFSQRKLSGKVTEIIDGKTAVVRIGTSANLTLVLQYVEIPEAEQPLNAVVKQHLSNLLLGKTVQFLPRGVVDSKTVAQVFIGDVDVSQQLIRDGAAWFAAAEKTEKSGAEVERYLANEALAKAEKRGVWSIEGMKPAWEFRAEKIKREKDREFARIEEITRQNREKYQRTNAKKLPPPSAFFSNYEMWKAGRTGGMWDEIQMYMGNQEFDEKGLFKYKIPNTPISLIATKDAPVSLSNGSSNPKVLCAVIYAVGKTKEQEAEKELFVMGCKSQAEKQSFKPTSQLTLSTDGKKMNFAKVIHLGRQADKRFDEMMIYFLDRTAVTKIAASENVQIKMGDFSGAMSPNFHAMIKNLVFESAQEINAENAKGSE